MSEIDNYRLAYLVTRMLDEMIAIIISLNEIKDIGIDGLNMSFEGEYPIEKMKVLNKYFDPYKHIEIKDFMVNVGAYISELSSMIKLDETGEYGILMEYLSENVEFIHYLGSVINKIERAQKEESEKSIEYE